LGRGKRGGTGAKKRLHPCPRGRRREERFARGFYIGKKNKAKTTTIAVNAHFHS